MGVGLALALSGGPIPLGRGAGPSGPADSDPLLRPEPYGLPTARVSGFTAPYCVDWPLAEGERLCWLGRGDLVWTVPDRNRLSGCGAWSPWRLLAPDLTVRARACRSGFKGDLQWEAWPAALLTLPWAESLPPSPSLDPDEAVALWELLEPLAPRLYWLNALIPYWEWECEGNWRPWRALPLKLGEVRYRYCVHETGVVWRQWEARSGTRP